MRKKILSKKLLSLALVLIMIASFLPITDFILTAKASSNFGLPLLQGNIITFGFGAYSSSQGKYHLGIDYGNSGNVATDVLAIADGEVYSTFKTANSGGWGNLVIIKHKTVDEKYYYSGYGHMVENSVCVSVGDKVSCGTKLGVMGSTGNSTGPHVHLFVCTGISSTSTIPSGYTTSSFSDTATKNGITYYNPSTVISTNGTCIYGTETENSTQPTTPNKPFGAVDICSGGNGTVFVRGWALDEDDLTQSLRIHIYIGGPSSESGEAHEVIANHSRPDVNEIYHCGDAHGYSETIVTRRTGTQNIYIYAINIGGGENILLDTITVNIGEMPKPTVENTYIGTVTNNSFQACLSLGNEGMIDHVTVAVWSNQNQNDMQWYDCENNGSNTFNHFINFSDFRDGANYFTCHFYVYQPTGTSFLASEISYTLNEPIVQNAYIGTVTNDSFQACITLDGLIDHVAVAVWSNHNQDDMQWYYCENNGSNTFNHFIKFSDFREGANYFICHFYVFQANGTSFLASALSYTLEEPTVNNVYVGTVTDDSFQVCASLDGIIDHVTVAVWSNHNQDDIQWYDCENNGFNTYNHFVNFSDHRDGAYYYDCHFYVFLPNGTAYFAGAISYSVPSYLTISTDKKEYTTNETITFSLTSDNTISKWIGIHKIENDNTILYKDTPVEGNQYSIQINEPGQYWANFDAINPLGTTRSDWVIFYVCSGHNWDIGSISTPATCTAEGIMTFTCTICSATKTEPIEKAAHTPEVVKGFAATCTTSGQTDATVCQECGTVLSTSQTIPTLGHRDENNDGYCDNCNVSLAELYGAEKQCVCGQYHTGILAPLIRFFHSIIYFFRNMHIGD